MSKPKWMYMGQIVEDGIYMLKDGDLYKCDPRIRFPIAKSVNIVTGKVHYPTNADRIRAMSDEELAEWLAKNDPECDPAEWWLEWLKEEVKDG